MVCRVTEQNAGCGDVPAARANIASYANQFNELRQQYAANAVVDPMTVALQNARNQDYALTANTQNGAAKREVGKGGLGQA